MDLRLFSRPGSDHRFFDQPRRIFTDVDPAARHSADCHAARLAQLQRRLRIHIDEHFLNRRTVGPVVDHQRGQHCIKMRETAGKRRGAVRLQPPVGKVRQPVAIRPDQAPACGPKAGIKPQDYHGVMRASGRPDQAIDCRLIPVIDPAFAKFAVRHRIDQHTVHLNHAIAGAESFAGNNRAPVGTGHH